VSQDVPDKPDPHRHPEKVRRMLRPRSVAVVGASEQPRSLGTRYLGGILRHGFEGSVYAVNPKYDTVMGLPAHDSIGDLPDGCDLAVLSVREDLVEGAMAECAERGIAGAMVFAGGYREIGPEGVERERRLIELARELGVRVIGPNSPGFVNFVDHVVATATSVAFRESFPPGGRLGVIAQSGGVAGIIAERAMDRGLGLSFMLCSGNEVDFDTPEAVEFLVDDPDTDAIAMYYEGVADPERLLAAWEYASAHDVPVIVFTPGNSEASRLAAASHTGSGSAAATTSIAAPPSSASCGCSISTRCWKRPPRSPGSRSLPTRASSCSPPPVAAPSWPPMRWAAPACGCRPWPGRCRPSWRRCCGRSGPSTTRST
jgi:acyl-CoA synthetase (NDP forming)